MAKLKPQLGSVTQNQLKASLCRESFYYFMQTFWGVVNPESIPVWNWHIKYLCDEAQKVMERVFNNQPKEYDLVVNVSPSSSKSNIFSIMLVAWAWSRKPSTRFICGSNTDRLALKLSLKCRDVIKSDLYKLFFPGIDLRKDQDAKGSWANTLGGDRTVCTVSGQSPIGLHGHALIIDDPIDPETAESEAEIARATRWMTTTLPSRVVNRAVVPTILVMQRFNACLLPNTKARSLDKGHTNIEDLSVGDFVLGSHGWQMIRNTSCSYYDGIAYGVRVSGNPETVWTTDHHSYLTKDGWKRADKLHDKDWIRFPLTKKNDDVVPWEPCLMAPPPKNPVGNFHGWPKKLAINREDLEPLVERGLTNTEIAKTLGVMRNTVHNYMWLYKISRIVDRHSLNTKDHLEDPDFWRLVGFWLAEGCYANGRKKRTCGLKFTFGPTEDELIQDIINILGKYDIPVNREEGPSVLICYVFCAQLSRWMKKYFGSGAHNKRLPEFVFSLSDKCKRELLYGWSIGDGSMDQKDKEWRVGSVSTSLLYGFQRLCLSAGIRCGVMGQETEPFLSKYNDKIRGGRILSSGKARELRWGRPIKHKKRVTCEIDNDCVWYKIKKISTKEYDGVVYDITTDSHDFVCGNATIHNCDPSAVMLESHSNPIKHLCFPAELTDDVKPEECKKFYKDGLFDPVRLPKTELVKIEIDNLYVYHSQYLQNPVPAGGGMFKKDWFNDKIVEIAPVDLKLIRYWDKAISRTKDAAFTCGTLVGKGDNGKFFILDEVRGKWDGVERNGVIRNTALFDGFDTKIGLEIEPGSGGKESAAVSIKELAGYIVEADRPVTNKMARAQAFASQCKAGNVYVLKKDWTKAWLDEVCRFPLGKWADRVDSAVGGFNHLCLDARVDIHKALDNIISKIPPKGVIIANGEELPYTDEVGVQWFGTYEEYHVWKIKDGSKQYVFSSTNRNEALLAAMLFGVPVNTKQLDEISESRQHEIRQQLGFDNKCENEIAVA